MLIKMITKIVKHSNRGSLSNLCNRHEVELRHKSVWPGS